MSDLQREAGEFAARLRAQAERVGPLSGEWDLIFDLEAIASNRETLVPAAEVMAMAREVTKPPVPTTPTPSSSSDPA